MAGSADYHNRCPVCGQFLPYSDPYGDSHVYRYHPERYEADRALYEKRQAELRREREVASHGG